MVLSCNKKNQGTKMVRVVVILLPKRSVATKVSIDPPCGKVSVDENDPVSS